LRLSLAETVQVEPTCGGQGVLLHFQWTDGISKGAKGEEAARITRSVSLLAQKWPISGQPKTVI
jgi:hypothetical protein